MSSTGRLDEQRDAGFIGSFGTPFARRVVTAPAPPLARDRLGRRMRSWPASRSASSDGRDERMCEPHASINYFAPGRDGSAVPVCVRGHFGRFERSGGRSACGPIASTVVSIGRPPTGAVDMMNALFRATLGGALIAASFSAVSAHDIYTGVHGKNGQLCCGGTDCAVTSYREQRRPLRIPDARAAMDRNPRGAHHLPADTRRSARQQRWPPRAFVLSLGNQLRSARPRLVERVRGHLPLLRVHSAGLDLDGSWGAKRYFCAAISTPPNSAPVAHYAAHWLSRGPAQRRPSACYSISRVRLSRRRRYRRSLACRRRGRYRSGPSEPACRP